MRKILLIVLLLVLGIAFVTNPSEDEHKAAVKEAFQEAVDAELEGSNLKKLKRVARALGELVAPELLDIAVERKNYYFFSITYVKQEDDFKPAGIGMFGTVFFFSKPGKGLQN